MKNTLKALVLTTLLLTSTVYSSTTPTDIEDLPPIQTRIIRNPDRTDLENMDIELEALDNGVRAFAQYEFADALTFFHRAIDFTGSPLGHLYMAHLEGYKGRLKAAENALDVVRYMYKDREISGQVLLENERWILRRLPHYPPEEEKRAP